MDNIKNALLLFLFACVGTGAYAQIEGGNGYAIGDYVEIAISGAGGQEGTAEGAGFHARGGAFSTPCGFVANPARDGWVDYDGDFFTPGSPENGWGIEINGTNYGNNYNINQILASPDKGITHSREGDCITVEWEGQVEGVTVNVKYHLLVGDLFYTTELTIHNGTGEDLTDVYYYRNVDPDNNQPIGGTFVTQNTIVSQPGDECQKALVSAEQSTPWDSYLGFGALGDKFRVSYRGFSNRSGSDIWNAIGLEGTPGATESGDQAMSLAYKTDIEDNDTVNFTFAIVLSEEAVESAFASLYYIDYESAGGIGGGVISQCNPSIDTVTSCAGNPVTLTVNGPNADDYDWTWTSDPEDDELETEGHTVEVSPTETTTYTVLGEPVSECLTETITKSIIVIYSEGPQLDITDPGPFCEDFELDLLEWRDLNDTEDAVWNFFSERPDSSTQVEPLYEDDFMGPDDEVWLMIGDTANGCYSTLRVIIDFGGLGAAGDDNTIELCGEEGVEVDLHDLISEGANPLGSFREVTGSGQFTAGTGILDVGGLAGTYTFEYTVTGVAPCPDDEAIFTVIVHGQPRADFEYEVTVDGVTSSSADGLASTCLINDVAFVDESRIAGDEDFEWFWNFGDGTTSTLENPVHRYSTTGTFTITLTVTTDEGCTSTYTKEIVIYEEPIIEFIYNDPTCNGLGDGSITVFTEGGSGFFTIRIMDEDDVQRNIEGTTTANGLTAGTYFITMEDASGCNASGTVTLTDPERPEPDYTIVEPLCYGDSGYVYVTDIVGESVNNPMTIIWNPDPSGVSGIRPNSDTSFFMTAGEYTITINDSKGCDYTVTITVDQPDEIKFVGEIEGTDEVGTGSEPAFCRVFNYQNGNGVVKASAFGGTGDLRYQWTDLTTGDVTNTSTWGARNPGDYLIVVTDDLGCTRDSIIRVDSLNPRANFEITSDQFTSNYKGTADVDAHFENLSEYFANPNNPNADTTFFWNFNSPEGPWILSEDLDETFDSTYLPKGESYEIEVCLVALNKNGCSDTLCKIINIYEPIKLNNVNIFTPNGDGVNDVFTFINHQASISEFSCVIVNRWGIKVHEMNDITDAWDGTDMNGSECQDGVYFYTYNAVSDNGTQIEGQSTVTIQSVE